MKRMHIHMGVEDLQHGVQFYSALFGAEPTKLKADYAKWMLDDPSVNFAISTRVGKGVDHLGLQVDEERELETIRARLKEADMALFSEGETTCCYSRSNKSWVKDPANIAWEAYHNMGDVALFNEREKIEGSACCVSKASNCC